jgi:hypothetical protein
VGAYSQRISLSFASALAFVLAFTALLLMQITIPITLIVGFGAALSANLMYLAGQWCNQLIKIPAEKHKAQDRSIRERDEKIAELTKPPTDVSYSQLQRATLLRLEQDGLPLLEQQISPNEPSPDRHLDRWLKQYQDWRKEILGILNETDATTFEMPASHTNNQILGISSTPVNPDHARARWQLLSAIGRLRAILERDKPE